MGLTRRYPFPILIIRAVIKEKLQPVAQSTPRNDKFGNCSLGRIAILFLHSHDAVVDGELWVGGEGGGLVWRIGLRGGERECVCLCVNVCVCMCKGNRLEDKKNLTHHLPTPPLHNHPPHLLSSLHNRPLHRLLIPQIDQLQRDLVS